MKLDSKQNYWITRLLGNKSRNNEFRLETQNVDWKQIRLETY